MNREDVVELIRAHLADELEVDPAGIGEGTRFKEDLEADSLDLVTLVNELEDRYGIRIPDEEAARIPPSATPPSSSSPGHRRARPEARHPLRRAPGGPGEAGPHPLVVGGAPFRSYERLAFLGDVC